MEATTANTTNDSSTVQDTTNMTGEPDVAGHFPGLPVFPPSPLYTFVLKTLLCGLVLLVTLIGNSLVLISYATTRKLRTYTNYYIVGLAVADLVSGGITPALLNVPWLIGYWPFGVPICRTFIYINIVFVHATFLLTFIICVDRYRAMSMPLRHLQEKNKTHALKMILPGFLVPAVIWTVMVLILPQYNLFRPVQPFMCYIPYASNRIILLVSSLFISWIPIIGTSSLYAFIYFTIIRRSGAKNPHLKCNRGSVPKERNSASFIESSEPESCPEFPVKQNPARTHPAYNYSKEEGTNRAVEAEGDRDGADEIRTNDHQDIVEMEPVAKQKHNGHLTRGRLPSSHHQKRLTSSRRATRTLAYISVVMVISGTPWFIYSLLATTVNNFPHIPSVSWLAGYMVHISSATNPFCYAICNPVFRQAFRRILCRCGRRISRKKN